MSQHTYSPQAQQDQPQPQSSPYRFISQAKLPTAYGVFDIHVFENSAGQEHVMLTCGLPLNNDSINDESTNSESTDNQGTDKQSINNQSVKSQSINNQSITNSSASNNSPKAPLVRIHSECLTGDAFASLKCDCGPQLDATMKAVQAEGCGAILYLRQEGRGIGLTNKIRAYALQDQGHDTLDANLLLGLPADARTYEMCKPMLEHVGIQRLRLLTNNPKKLSYLEDLGFEIVERIPLVVGLNPFNIHYLNTKRNRMGHYLSDNLSDKLNDNSNIDIADNLTSATFTAIADTPISEQ